MDFVYIIILVCFIFGVGMLMYSLYDFYGNKETSGNADGYLTRSIESKIDEIGTSVADADNVINELTDISQTLFKEIDSKYEELLFLYNLIDEKKSNSTTQPIIEEVNINNTSLTEDLKSYSIRQDHEKTNKIFELRNKNYSVQEISKELGMGQGEVSLIISLNKGR